MICAKDDSGDCCGLCHYKPIVVIATHDRIEITTANIKLLNKQSIIPKIVLVCSDRDEFEYYKLLGITVAMEPNKPLGRKWHVGVNLAYNMGANPVIIVGSDDILAPDYIKKSLQKMNEGFHLIGCTSWYSYDVKRKLLYKSDYIGINVDFPLGSGKVYSRLILDSCSAKIFDRDADRKLDDLGHKKAQGFKTFLFRTPEILAVKGRWTQLNPIEKYIGVRNIRTKEVNLKLIDNFGYKEYMAGEHGNSFVCAE